MTYAIGDVVSDRFGSTYVITDVRADGTFTGLTIQLSNSNTSYVGQSLRFYFTEASQWSTHTRNGYPV